MLYLFGRRVSHAPPESFAEADVNRLLLATSALVSLVAAGTTDAGYAPTVGARHPDFTLPDIATGKPVSLADFRGKKVLLIQFASW